MRRKGIALCAAVLGLAFAPPAFADRIVVDNDFADCPNADTNSIEAGVELASPGDTVFVCRGIYSEMVTMEPDDSNIRVRGQDVDETILDGLAFGTATMTAGFHLGGVTDVVVERFTVRRYHDDIVVDGGGDNVIRRNITTLAWGHDGITLQNSHGNLVERNVSFLNQNSIACGISVGAGSSNNLVRHNLVFNNSNVGILIGFPPSLGGPAGAGNVVVHNVSRDNGKPVPAASGGTGILNNNSPETTIAHNKVRDNAANGIFITAGASTNVLVEHNKVSGSGRNGVLLASAPGNTVGHNKIEGNTLDGIGLVNGDNNTIEHNKSEDNGQDGLHADSASAGNTISHNRMRGNAVFDCRDDSAGPGTAGTANLWIKNKGETENRPGLCKP